MSRVLVVDADRRVLAPCTARRARLLLSGGKAAVLRRYPFTIILKQSYPTASPRPVRLKLDPGSKTTGIAVVTEATGEVVWAAELQHRGQLIKDALESRRSLRSSRRNRKTRYRPPRWRNRKRTGPPVLSSAGEVNQLGKWLAPSLQHRIEVIMTWVHRLRRYLPITAISQEIVRFDMQKMQNPEISGVEYQQGTLFGFEVREYLLDKWHRRCGYCGAQNTRLEVDHIVPRSHGGSDRVSNLTLSCEPCNKKKSNRPAALFLAKKPEVLQKLQRQAKAPLKDAAAVNSTRYALLERLKATGLPVEIASGGRTKFNRFERQIPKTHWLDAACVGASTPEVLQWEAVRPLAIKAMGHGKRQVTNVDAYGFPKGKPKGIPVHPFRTGDVVRAEVPVGKFAGNYVDRIVAIRTDQTRVSLPLRSQEKGKKKVPFLFQTKYITAKLFSADGYDYGFLQPPEPRTQRTES